LQDCINYFICYSGIKWRPDKCIARVWSSRDAFYHFNTIKLQCVRLELRSWGEKYYYLTTALRIIIVSLGANFIYSYFKQGNIKKNILWPFPTNKSSSATESNNSYYTIQILIVSYNIKWSRCSFIFKHFKFILSYYVIFNPLN
jgi:hypothetical protein